MEQKDARHLLLDLINALIDGSPSRIRMALAVVEKVNPADEVHSELIDSLRTLAKDQLEAAEFIGELGKGHLSIEAPPSVARLGQYKQLQANLRHVKWVMERVTAGDYNHQIDFMGEFEQSINRTIVALREKADLENRLRVSEQLFRNVVEKSPTNITIVDLKGNILFINDSGRALFGYEAEDKLVGMNISSLLTEESLDRAMANIIMRPGETLTGVGEYQGIRKDGSMHWIEVHGNILTDLEGRTDRFLLLVWDIDYRKRLEKALENSEMRYRTMVESSSSMVFILDDQLNIMYTNRQAGLAAGPGSTGTSMSKYLEDLSTVNMLSALFRTGEGVVVTKDTIMDSAEGNRLWVQMTAQMVPFEDRKAIFVSCNDITNLKRTETQLRSATRKLTLLGSLTRHDVLNYLTSLEGYLELAQIKNKDEKVEVYLQKARQNSKNILHQMELTRTYQNLGTMDPEWIDIRSGVEREMAGVEFGSVHLIDELPELEILADPIILSCIKNVVQNSLKHGQKTTFVRFSFQVMGGNGILAIEDDGKGIPAAMKEQIFDWGFKGRTGHGLHFIREALSASGLWIRENGVEGQGARFEIIVPLESYRVIKLDQ